MIAAIFSSDKKSAMPYDALIEKVVATAEVPFDRNETMELISRLVSLIPQFIHVYSTEPTTQPWVKVDRKAYVAALCVVNGSVV
jgi:hypothetical protein